MASYLERYQQGEHRQVWQELVDLGEQIRTEPLLSDAYAVATEMMRRVNHNVTILVERLQALGYIFYDPDGVHVPASAEELQELAELEAQLGFVPLTLRAWAEQVGSVNLMGNYPRLCYYIGSHIGSGKGDVLMGLARNPETGSTEPAELNIDDLYNEMRDNDAIPPQLKDMFAGLKDMMQGMGMSSLPVVPAKPDIPEAEQFVSDPLSFDLHELSWDAYQMWELEEDEPYHALIAPDVLHKSGISGGDGYAIELPCPTFDAPLLNTDYPDISFVEYLRLSFAWAGFPGVQEYDNRDETLIASLKADLLHF